MADCVLTMNRCATVFRRNFPILLFALLPSLSLSPAPAFSQQIEYDFAGGSVWPESESAKALEAERQKWQLGGRTQEKRPKVSGFLSGLRGGGLEKLDELVGDGLEGLLPSNRATHFSAPPAPFEPRGGSTNVRPLPDPGQDAVGTVRFPEHNFELTAPGPTWEVVPQIYLERFGADTVTAMGSLLDEQFIKVIAERIGTDAKVTTAMLQEIAVDSLKLTLTDVKPSPPVAMQIDGLNGLRTTVHAKMKIGGIDRPVAYVSWVCMHNGIGWQLISWAPNSNSAGLEETWKNIPKCFRLIDHSQTVRTTNEFSRRLHSKRFGIEADLSETKYFITTAINDEQDGAMLVAGAGVDRFLSIAPYTLPETRPSKKLIVESLLAAFRADVAQARLKAKRVQHGPYQAIEYHEIPSALDPNRQRFFRICFADSCAFIIIGDSPIAKTQYVQEWITAANQIQFSPPRSIDVEQFTTNDRVRHAAFYSQLGLASYEQGNANLLGEYAMLAHKIHPTDLTIYEESIDRLLTVGNFELAMQLLEDLPPGIAIDPVRRAQQAWVLSEVGRTEESLLKYEELFQTSYENAEHLEIYTELLANAGRTDDALAIVDRQIQASPTIKLATARAQILITGNRKAEAVAWLKQQRDESALAQNEYSLALIDVLLQADEDREALREVTQLEQTGEATPRLLLFKGLAEFKLERFGDARKSLEATLEQAPNLTLAKQLLEVVSSRLGQGDVSAVLEKLEPVPLPSQVARRHSPPASLRDDDSYWIELNARSISFKPDEELRRTQTQIIHLLNRKAVESFGRLQFDFDSLTENFYVNRAEVYDEAGKLLGATDPRDCFILSNEADGLATNQKTLNVPLPGLRPGCRIEYQVTWQQHRAPDKFPSRRYTTAKYSPTSQVVVSVTGDLSTLRWTGPQPTQTATGILWDIPAARLQSENMIDDLAVSPDTICLGDSQHSWKSIGDEYLADIQDRLTHSPQAATIVRQQLAGLESQPSSKQVDRLAEWVREQLTYQGIEFGQRAWMMPPVEQTLQNRYGDCKDHSLLLWQLLQAAGIKSHLALVNVGEPVELRLPSFAQFNHMIVYVEDDLGPRFIDCTDKSVSGSIRIPMGLALKVALVLDPENPHVLRLGDYPEDYNRVWVDRQVTLDADGAATINETLWFDGYMASFMRQLMGTADREDQKALVRSLLPATADASIANLHFESPDDLSKQPVLQVSYSTPHYVSAVPGQLIGRVNVLDGLGGVEPENEEKREQPFRLRMPLDTSARIRIKAPDGFTVSETPEREVVQTKVLDAVRETSLDKDTLEMRVRIRRRTARLHPSAWSNWRSACQQVNDLLHPSLILTR